MCSVGRLNPDNIGPGEDRPPPMLGGGSESEEWESSDGSEALPMAGKGRGYDSSDGGGGSAGDSNEEEWAAVDAFARRSSRPARGSGGSGKFSRIEDEVRLQAVDGVVMRGAR
jgi:hypothetical protein